VEKGPAKKGLGKTAQKKKKKVQAGGRRLRKKGGGIPRKSLINRLATEFRQRKRSKGKPLIGPGSQKLKELGPRQ